MIDLTPEQMDEARRKVLFEMGDRRLLNDVDEDLHEEISNALVAAVLPLVERAALEKAARIAEGQYESSTMATGVLLHRINAANMRGVSIASAIRAQADEVGR